LTKLSAVEVIMSATGSTHDVMRRHAASNKYRSGLELALLACGIAYGLGYVITNDVIAAGMWDRYSRIDQAISELSSTEAPSKGFLTAMLPLFTVLVIGFGIGVWNAAGKSRALRLTAVILVAQGLMFPIWLLFPMTSREEITQSGGSTNDVGHLVLSVLAILFILIEMGSSAVALGKGFRYFAIAMAIAVVATGGYVGSTTSDVAAGDPTPWMGFVERISYGAWLLWMAVLASVLLRRTRDAIGN
jgi:hypothetical protein